MYRKFGNMRINFVLGIFLLLSTYTGFAIGKSNYRSEIASSEKPIREKQNTLKLISPLLATGDSIRLKSFKTLDQ